MLKIAITGNIASGKSQAENYLKNKYPVYDSDVIAHEVLYDLTGFYNYDVFTDGKIDRKKLGNLVFNNPDAKLKLEKIIHPKVKEKIIELFEKHKNEKCIFISVPLLYEAGFENMFDYVIFISVEDELQLKRLMTRNNLDKNGALKRINAQLPQSDKIRKADFVIQNNSNLENLYTQIDLILQKLNI